MTASNQVPCDTFEISKVRDVRRLHSQILTAWAVVSVVVGVVIWSGQTDDPLTRFFVAVGMQFVIWGAIDLIFGLIGLQQARTADAIPVYSNQATGEIADAKKLAKTLIFSMKLNWIWLVIGLALIVWGVSSNMNSSLLGNGVGVLVQGLFLFVFDKHFYSKLTKAMG